MPIHYIPGQTPMHSALVWGRAVAQSLKFSPLQSGKLLSLLIADQLPPGLIKDSIGGKESFAVEPDLFARTLRAQFGCLTTSASVDGMAKNLKPDIPTLFPLASTTWVFLPCTQAFQPYLLGAQPDIVKVVPASLWKSLAGICVTDPNFVGRMEPSFPVFKNLASIVFAKKPVTFIGAAAEIERIRQIVDLELFDLSTDTLRTIIASLPGYTGISAEQMELEHEFLGIRPGFKPYDNGTTPLLPLSAYLRLITFEQTNNPKIIRTAKNQFLVTDDFGEYPVDLADTRPQSVIAMSKEDLPEAPFSGIPDNSVYMVSTGNGMVPGITVCFIVKVNGMSILIEAPAYADHYLGELGLKLTNFDYVHISHHHHDHDSLGMLLPQFQSKRPTLIMSPFTSYASISKAALSIGNISPTEVKASLNQLNIYPGKPIILEKDGKKIKLEVLDGFHSVRSTMLAVYSWDDNSQTWVKEVVYTGDTLGPRGLAQAVKAGVISQERMDEIINFVKDAKVVVIDTGGNIIHPEPEEIIQEWQPHVTGIIKLIHNVVEDVKKGKIKKAELASLAENQDLAWKALIEKGYMVEVMGTGVLTPSFTGKREDFSLGQTAVLAHEDALFKILETAHNIALEAAGKMGVSGEIIPLNSLELSVATIQQVPLMQGLSPSTVLKLAQGANIVWAKRGTTLIETGDTSDDRFFIVRKGTVEVLINDSEGNERKIILGSGQMFGERRVLLGTPANATVRSLSGCELLVLTRQQYEKLTQSERIAMLGNVLKTERLRPILQTAFPQAPIEVINYLIMAAHERQYQFGNYIITEGSKELDKMFIIVGGEISVWQTIEGQKVKVAQIGPNEHIGETGIITGKPRNADCVVDSMFANVLAISAGAIESLRRTYPLVDLTLKQVIEQRKPGYPR